MENEYRVAEIDCTNNSVTYRDMTEEEVANLKKANDDFFAHEAAREEKHAQLEALKDSARAKLVAGQPLTEEEAATIVL